MALFGQRPAKLHQKPSVIPAVEVIAPGGSYNPDFISHQVAPTSVPLDVVTDATFRNVKTRRY